MSAKEYSFEGRAWTIIDNKNELIPDVDTDQIFHNKYLHITEIDEMGEYTFDNLEGWKDFSQKAKSGDIVIAGSNFGAGSSRQQAVDCFRALDVKVIIATSFGAIYKRNAINSGFPILILTNGEKVVSEQKITNLSKVKVELKEGKLTNLDSGEVFDLVPFSKVQTDIYENDTLLNI